jgi:hypothetical protein
MNKYIYVKKKETINKGRKEEGKYKSKERMFEICKLQLNNNTICKCGINFWLVIWLTTTCGM